MKDASDFLSRGLAMTTPHPLGERIVRAEGCWLETESGERLFDLVSGIGVSNLGHGHPAIREALHAQVDQHLHVMVYGSMRNRRRTLLPRCCCPRSKTRPSIPSTSSTVAPRPLKGP